MDDIQILLCLMDDLERNYEKSNPIMMNDNYKKGESICRTESF